MAHRPELRVLDAARMAADEINGFIKLYRLSNAKQLSQAAESVSSNIQEGFGRDVGRDRNRFLFFARGSAEEANDRWRSRFGDKEIPATVYWPVHHRLVTISRMLTNLMTDL